MEIFYWVINGFLIVLYLLIQNWPVLALAPAVIYLAQKSPAQYRPWMLATVGMTIALGLLIPLLGIWMAAMAWLGVLACKIEHFNPDMLRWRVNTFLITYSLLGLASVVVQRFVPDLESTFAVGTAGLTLQGGADYFGTIVNWALIVILPMGYLALLAQAIFTMPPVHARPEQLITEIRTRGRGEGDGW
jgi:hypothetical protein